jgi:rod shape-determining protein MreB
MFDALKPLLYIRLSPVRLTVRNVKTGEFISEPPEIAISRGPKEKILGVGSEAALHKSSKSAHVINPFAHPRSMMSDFTAGQEVVKAFVRKLRKSGPLRRRPAWYFTRRATPPAASPRWKSGRFAKWHWARALRKSSSGRGRT